ncbi:MAG: Rieske (2Fe-2S) protein [Frankiales bacterium]|nr:Rieske (2Fe-2S) protein [Frankiales bacterium]
MWWSALTGRLEQAKALDPVVERVAGVVATVLPRGPVKDALHGTWLGHALHPMLVAGPIGLWSGAVLLDLTAGEQGRDSARRLVGAGVLAVAPTAASGWADWSELGLAKRPKRVGLVHAAANLTTTVLYAGSWLARRRGDDRRGRALALAGVGGLAIGGYLGGHLAYAEAVGVSRTADEPPGPREWTDVAAAVDLAEGGLLRVDVGSRAVLLSRVGGVVGAVGATCSHWGGPLEQGAVQDGCVECPWHGSRFRLTDGGVERGPATNAQRAYDVRTVAGRLQVKGR